MSSTVASVKAGLSPNRNNTTTIGLPPKGQNSSRRQSLTKIIPANHRDAFQMDWITNTEHLTDSGSLSLNRRNILSSKVNTPGSQFFRRHANFLSTVRGNQYRYDYGGGSEAGDGDRAPDEYYSTLRSPLHGRESPFWSGGQLNELEKSRLNNLAQHILPTIIAFQARCRRFLARRRADRLRIRQPTRVCPICHSSATRIERAELENCQKDLEFYRNQVTVMTEECERNKINMEEIHELQKSKLQQKLDGNEMLLKQMEQSRTMLQTELDQLKQELIYKNEELATLHQQLLHTNKQYQQQKMIFDKKMEEANNLREENRKSDETIADLQTFIKRQTATRQSEEVFYKRISELSTENEKLVQDNEQIRKLTTTLKNDLSKTKERYDELHEYLLEVNSQNAKLEGNVKTLKASLERSRQDHEEEISEIQTNSHKKVREIQQQLDDEIDSKDQLQRTLREYERQIKNLQAQSEDLIKLDDLKDKNHALKEELKALWLKMNSLQVEYDAYKENNVSDAAMKRVEELSKEAEDHYKCKQELDEKLHNLQLIKSKLEFSLTESEDKCQTLYKEKQNLQQKFQNKSKECTQLTEQIHQITADLLTNSQALQIKNKETERYMLDNYNLQQELSDLKHKLEDVNSNKTSEDEMNRLIQLVKQDMRNLEKEKDAIIDGLHEDIMRMQREMRSLQTEVEMAGNKDLANQSQIRKLRRQITDYEEEMDSLKRRLSDFERRYSELEIEMKKQEEEWRQAWEDQLAYMETQTNQNDGHWNDDEDTVTLQGDYADDSSDVGGNDNGGVESNTWRRGGGYSTLERSNTLTRNNKFNKHEDLLNQVDAALNERRSAFRAPTTSSFHRSISIRELRSSSNAPKRSLSIKTLNKN